MSSVRNLFVFVLSLAGALCWGPPTVLAICLRGTPVVVATAPSCCRPVPAAKPAVDGYGPSACRGCCAKVHVGLGLDGAGTRADAPVAPAPAAPVVLVTPEFLAPAPPVARPVPRPPPEKVLPLRI